MISTFVAVLRDLGDFVVVFRRNETRLAERDLAELPRWVRSWWSADRWGWLVVG